MQFLLESFCVTGIGSIIGIVLVNLLLPTYNSMIHETLEIDYDSVEVWLFGAGLIIITSLMAGSYPAFYFSSFRPSKVLKGKLQAGRNANLLRKILVTVQYVISIFLVIAIIVIHQQIQHVKSRELGYDQKNLIMIPCNEEIEKNYAFVKNELLNSGLVESVAKSNQAIYQDYWSEFVEWNGKPTDDKISFATISTDYDYVKTNQIRVVEGRNFSGEFRSDSNAVLINRAAVAILGFKDPIGEKLRFLRHEWTIVGVLENVLIGSPYEPIGPLVVGMLGYGNQYITMRLSKTMDLQASVKKLESVLMRLNPSNIPEIMFADQRFAYKFGTIEFIGRLANVYAFLTIILTALGVFGLSAYTAEQRTKEMAIRKVLGATARNLVLLLSSYFTRIAIFAVIIAAPLSWWALDSYLKNYSYRISIPWWTIPLTSVVILLITLLIVTTQVLKAALANPVNSLKGE
jgi:putative ABC transport system permease protein